MLESARFDTEFDTPFFEPLKIRAFVMSVGPSPIVVYNARLVTALAVD